MSTHNSIFFERPMQEFHTLFDYTFQEVPTLNLLNMNISSGEHGTITDQTNHIINKITQ